MLSGQKDRKAKGRFQSPHNRVGGAERLYRRSRKGERRFKKHCIRQPGNVKGRFYSALRYLRGLAAAEFYNAQEHSGNYFKPNPVGLPAYGTVCANIYRGRAAA